MARGWESKSVELQVESVEDRRRPADVLINVLQLELERKRDGLSLQRKRISGQLDSCSEERYRTTLSAGLAFLDSELAQVNHLISSSIK